MAADLAADPNFEVTIADIREESLARAAARLPGRIRTLNADLSSPDIIRSSVAGFDIVLGALSSRIGFGALRAVIEAGKPYCDISFMAEDFLELDALARQQLEQKAMRTVELVLRELGAAQSVLVADEHELILGDNQALQGRDDARE